MLFSNRIKTRFELEILINGITDKQYQKMLVIETYVDCGKKSKITVFNKLRL